MTATSATGQSATLAVPETSAGHVMLMRALADRLITFLETGRPPVGLFTPQAFVDFTMPHWRLQAEGAEQVVAMRQHGHPSPGRVPRHRFDPTPTGFVLEVEEAWHDDSGDWYCRELFRADTTDAGITQLSVYCTGDWDATRVAEHQATIQLIRP